MRQQGRWHRRFLAEIHATPLASRTEQVIREKNRGESNCNHFAEEWQKVNERYAGPRVEQQYDEHVAKQLHSISKITPQP